MKLEHSFEVPASPDQTLALLLDVERVVPCMPGATLKEVVGDDTWKTEMGIRLGPVRCSSSSRSSCSTATTWRTR